MPFAAVFAAVGVFTTLRIVFEKPLDAIDSQVVEWTYTHRLRVILVCTLSALVGLSLLAWMITSGPNMLMRQINTVASLEKELADTFILFWIMMSFCTPIYVMVARKNSGQFDDDLSVGKADKDAVSNISY